MATRKTISIRLTEPEFAKIKAQCAKANMTIASFAQLAVLGFAVESPKEFLAAIKHVSAADIMAFVVKTTPIIAPISTEQLMVIDTCNTCLSNIRRLLLNGDKTKENQILSVEIEYLHDLISYLVSTAYEK